MGQILPLPAEVHKLSEGLPEEEREVIGRFMEAATATYNQQAQYSRSENP